MQFVGNLPPLFLLHGDELAVEPAIFIARGAKGAGKRVESFGENGELLHFR